MESLTERQAQIYRLLERGIMEDGVTPTYREIADEIGVDSPATVCEHIEHLEERGWLERIAGSRGRRIRLTHPTCPNCGERLRLTR